VHGVHAKARRTAKARNVLYPRLHRVGRHLFFLFYDPAQGLRRKIVLCRLSRFRVNPSVSPRLCGEPNLEENKTAGTL
jgi:hypothetical protein